MSERIVFMGTPDFAAGVLKGLLNAGYQIVGVVSQPDKEVGRKRVLTASPVKAVAMEAGIPVFTPQKIRNEYTDILALEPDLIITCAYGQIIPSAILDYPRYRCINTHGSLLPKYRGGAPIQRAIMNGEKETGITIMYMNEKMDEGDILYQRSLKINDDDTSASLFASLSDLALKMLLDFLPRFFKGDFEAKAQDHDAATYAYNLKKSEEFISFREPVKKTYDHIRSLLDNPGAFFILKNKKYKIIEAAYQEAKNCRAGCFVGLSDEGLRIDCPDGYILVKTIRPEGKNTMDARSFFNGSGRGLVGEITEESEDGTR